MSIPGLFFALLLALFVLVWVIMPLFQSEHPPQEDPLLEKQRERLLIYYERVLRNIRDLDEDHALGKMSEDEYTQERTEWTQRGVQVLEALDSIHAREMIAPTPAEDTAVDHAIDDAIESAIQRYRQRNPQ